MNHEFWIRAFLLVVIDQSSKLLAQNLDLQIVRNKGIAFSILSDINPIFIAVILLFLIKYFSKNVWSTLIVAGGVSNLIDRVRLGYVVDFIDLKFWPVFNLADVFITIGFSGILYGYIRRR